MEKIKAKPVNDPLYDYAIDVVDPASPGSARIAKVLIKADADMLVRAVNAYDEHVEILNQMQNRLANMRSLSQHPGLVELSTQIDKALVAHHEYLEESKP